MRALMIRLLSFFRSRNRHPEPPAAPEDTRAIQMFVAGFTLAMTRGIDALGDRLVEEAARRALADLEPTIVARAEAAGAASPKAVIDLQAKRRDFEAKMTAAPEGLAKTKYAHYIEAINWMLGDTNGHA